MWIKNLFSFLNIKWVSERVSQSVGQSFSLSVSHSMSLSVKFYWRLSAYSLVSANFGGIRGTIRGESARNELPLAVTADRFRPHLVDKQKYGSQHVSNVCTICKCCLDLLFDLVTSSSTQSSFTLKNDFFSWAVLNNEKKDKEHEAEPECFGVFCHNLGSHNDEFYIPILLCENFSERVQVSLTTLCTGLRKEYT